MTQSNTLERNMLTGHVAMTDVTLLMAAVALWVASRDTLENPKVLSCFVYVCFIILPIQSFSVTVAVSFHITGRALMTLIGLSVISLAPLAASGHFGYGKDGEAGRLWSDPQAYAATARRLPLRHQFVAA